MHDYSMPLGEQIRKNRWRTFYLFVTFPIVILLLTYIGIIIAIVTSSNTAQYSLVDLANEMMSTIGFWVLVAVAGWSFISYFLGHKLVLGFAGAKPIEKRDQVELYRVVENASIAAGLPKTPDIYIIEDQSLNAFATGRSPNKSMVAISRGLLEKLSKAELEGVMAHEVGHILNRDIRVMMLMVTLAGAVSMVGEILVRTSRGSSRSNNRGGNPLVIIGILFLTIGVLVATLTRLAVSREREYMADATSAQLTTNPLALASALEKIAGDARLEVLDGKSSVSGLCIADPTATGAEKNKAFSSTGLDDKKPSKLSSYWDNLWSTHPPIADRIKRLKGM